VTLPGAFFLGMGSLIILGWRNHLRKSRKLKDLLYRDPALWVRALPVTPFPSKNLTQSRPSPTAEPRPAPGRPPIVHSNATSAVLRYGREEHDLLEKRCALRRQGNPTSVQMAVGTAKMFSGWVMDRSRKGLRVACPENLEVGLTISIRSTHYGDSGPWVLARVRHSDPFEEGWVIGFSFAAALPWEVLLRFG
jgi:hypothetical protein